MTRVLILMGGESQEREVSLRSGQAVYEALQDSSYEVMKLDFKSDAINQLIEIDPDVVFIALHGKNGEDGTVRACWNSWANLIPVQGLPPVPFV